MSRDICTYYVDILRDVKELKEEYPFTRLTILPTTKPEEATLRVIAANKELIDTIGAVESDFTGKYNKAVDVEVPFDYKVSGCLVYGGKWVDMKSLKKEYRHFNGIRSDGEYLLCVGVPQSFIGLRNVILENVRTAEKLLTAYELYDVGETKELELFSYSHGRNGMEEYERTKKKKRK